MPVTPFGVEVGILYRLTGPDGTSVSFNDITQSDFVGYTEEVTGLDGPDTRESADLIVEGDGGYHGNFYHGRRPIVLSGIIDPNTFGAARNTMVSNLLRATNAMRQDAVLSWTPTGGDPVAVRVRRQQPPRVTGGRVKSFQVALVAADPRVYGTAERTLARTSEASPSGWWGHTGNGEYDAAALYLAPALHLSLGNVAGLTDQSGNGRNGTGLGGVVIGGASPGPYVRGNAGATDFDGTDDRITVPYATRRNYALDPRGRTRTTDNWRTDGTFTLPTDDTSWIYTGAARWTVGPVASGNYICGTHYEPISGKSAWPVVAGTRYSSDMRFFNWGNQTLTIEWNWRNSAGASLGSGTTTVAPGFDNHLRLITNALAPANAVVFDWTVVNLSGSSYTGSVLITNMILEAAASIGDYDYFDGDGYIPPAGGWASDGATGWLGVAHKSSSDKGCFANGTVRTFSYWMKSDVLALVCPLASGSATPYNIVGQFAADGNTMTLYMNSVSVAVWTALGLTAGVWYHIAVTVNEPADTAEMFVNGVSKGTKALGSNQWGADATGLMQIGQYAGGQHFDGKMAGVDIFQRALTAAEIRWLYEEGARNMAFNKGNADTPVVMRITGPITNPVIWNMTTGTLFTLTGTISAGNWWEIDTSDGTIVDQAGVNQYGKMVFASSEWKDLRPGVNDLRLVGTGTTGATELKLTWKDAWI